MSISNVDKFIKHSKREVPLFLKTIFCSEEALERSLISAEVSIPALSLTGFTDFFHPERIQILGRGEHSYLQYLVDTNKLDLIYNFLSTKIPCILLSYNNLPPVEFVELCKTKDIPIFRSTLSTGQLMRNSLSILDYLLSPTKIIQGGLIDIWGVGVLLLGKSGVGKSETALELIERGHRLVADDVVEVRKLENSVLEGKYKDILQHLMEIRGIGIIDIRALYGIQAVRPSAKINLVITLEEWDSKKVYDRTGIEEATIEILDVKLPLIEIPVLPGRYIPVIIETAAMNYRLKSYGINSAKELQEKISFLIKRGTGNILNEFSKNGDF